MSATARHLPVLILAIVCLVPSLGLADAANPPESSTTPANDSTITSFWIASSKLSGTKEDRERVRKGEIESVELRYHMGERHPLGGLYFEAIHHRPGLSEESIAHEAYDQVAIDNTVKKDDRSDRETSVRPYKVQETFGDAKVTTTHYGLTFDDYTYSNRKLKKDAADLWGKLFKYQPVSNGQALAGAYTVGTFAAGYGLVRLGVKKEWKLFVKAHAKALELHKGWGLLFMAGLDIAVIAATWKWWDSTLTDHYHGQELKWRDWLYDALLAGDRSLASGTLDYEPVAAKVTAAWDAYLKERAGGGSGEDEDTSGGSGDEGGNKNPGAGGKDGAAKDSEPKDIYRVLEPMTEVVDTFKKYFEDYALFVADDDSAGKLGTADGSAPKP